MPDRDFSAKDGGFIQVMNEFVDAMRTYRLSTTEWSVVMHIMRRTWGDRGKAWAPIRSVDFVDKCEITKMSVSRSLRRLTEERNFIQTKKIKGKVNYKINSKPSTWVKPNSYPAAIKTVTKKGNSTVTKKDQNCYEKVTELVLSDDSTFKRKDNIKRQGKDTPLPPTKNGDTGSTVLTKKQIIEADAKTVVDYINELSGKTFKHSQTSLEKIRARLNDGYTLEQCLTVCLNKWLDPDHQEKYYRPITLFRPSLFESYVNEKGTKKKLSKQETKRLERLKVFARRHYAREQGNSPGGD